MSESNFAFLECLLHATSLRGRLIDVLESSDDEKVRALVSDVPTMREPKDGNEKRGAALTVGFVGQYNAGKSTIISALTGKRDIPIDADICTDKVTAYDWEGIRLLDTPGIHAGYLDHDAVTYRAIDHADLLVFVITNELFDDIMGMHFRSLAFDRDKAQETLLVVNKMGQDPGSATVKRPDLERVMNPLSLDDFRTTFIDALSFIEAMDEVESDDRAELLEIAAFDGFVSALNSFVQDRGLMGRLTTPMFGIRAVARQGEAYLAVDMPEERAALELLHRKRGLFLSSRVRLRGTLSGRVAAAASDLVAYGDEVAEMIEPGSTEASVHSHLEQAQRRAEERCSQLEKDAKSAVEMELSDLHRQLEALQNGVLARELRGQVDAALTRTAPSSDVEERSEIEWQLPEETVLSDWPSDWPSRLKGIGDVAKSLGGRAADLTAGRFANSARVGSATAARGSQGHRIVYDVGKFFGVKFKPWGAVKIARAMGNAGRIISAVGGVLAVGAQVVEDRQQEKHRRQLRDARDSMRSVFRKSVRAYEEAFWSRFDELEEDFYEDEISTLDGIVSILVGQRGARTRTAEALGALREETTQLIEEVQGAPK